MRSLDKRSVCVCVCVCVCVYICARVCVHYHYTLQYRSHVPHPPTHTHTHARNQHVYLNSNVHTYSHTIIIITTTITPFQPHNIFLQVVVNVHVINRCVGQARCSEWPAQVGDYRLGRLGVLAKRLPTDFPVHCCI